MQARRGKTLLCPGDIPVHTSGLGAIKKPGYTTAYGLNTQFSCFNKFTQTQKIFHKSAIIM